MADPVNTIDSDGSTLWPIAKNHKGVERRIVGMYRNEGRKKSNVIKMKKTTILSFLVLLSIMSAHAQKSMQYEDFFAEFISRFSSDSTFQLDRVKFPLIFQTFNCENGVDEQVTVNIDREDYRAITLINSDCSTTSYNVVSADLKSDFVKLKTLVFNVIGIDNDQFDRYVFENINGIWFLIRIISNDNWFADIN